MRVPLALAAGASALTPGVAAACASCARDQTPWAVFLVAGMIAAPYVVAILVVRVVRASGDAP